MKSFRLTFCRVAAAATRAGFLAVLGIVPGRLAAADTSPLAAGSPVSRSDITRLSSADREILKTLQQPTQLRFKAQRLTDVIASLGRQHGIRVQLDKRALWAVGVYPDDCPVTKDTGDISLHSALRLLLGDLDLTCVVNRGVLLITTLPEGRRLLRQGAIAPAAYWKSSESAAAAQRKIAEELKRPVQVECFNTPWGDVLDSLRKQARIEIQLDHKALDNAGFNISLPKITLDLKDVPFASVLGQLVRKVGLTYVVEDDFILITTPKRAKPQNPSPLPPGNG
jgi:hypothetical protein